MDNTYDIHVQAKAVWEDTSLKDSKSFSSNGVKPVDARPTISKFTDQAVSDALNTQAKTDPKEIQVWNRVKANYGDGRTATRQSWIRESKSAEDARKASAQWVEHALTQLMAIGKDDV